MRCPKTAPQNYNPFPANYKYVEKQNKKNKILLLLLMEVQVFWTNGLANSEPQRWACLSTTQGQTSPCRAEPLCNLFQQEIDEKSLNGYGKTSQLLHGQRASTGPINCKFTNQKHHYTINGREYRSRGSQVTLMELPLQEGNLRGREKVFPTNSVITLNVSSPNLHFHLP